MLYVVVLCLFVPLKNINKNKKRLKLTKFTIPLDSIRQLHFLIAKLSFQIPENYRYFLEMYLTFKNRQEKK